MWTNWRGQDVLGRAIEKGDNLFFFQSLVLHSFRVSLKEAMGEAPDLIIPERSPRTAAEVFSKIAFEDGK